MSTIKSKKVQIGTDATASNNFTMYQPATPDGTLRIGVGNADSPTEVGQFNANGYKPATAPLFNVKLTTNQTVSSNTWTVLQFNYEVYDTTSNFDASTYKFQPTVAGYYHIIVTIFRTANNGDFTSGIWKNGSKFSQGVYGNTGLYAVSHSNIVYLNGTTDYVQGMMYASTSLTAGSGDCHFSGHLIQQA